jgi:hypothetical protein
VVFFDAGWRSGTPPRADWSPALMNTNGNVGRGFNYLLAVEGSNVRR